MISRSARTGMAVLSLGLVAAWSGAAHANKLRSRLTTLDLKTCTATLVQTTKAWRCAGLRGYPVIYFEREQRAFVSFGAAASDRLAARQSFKARNSIFDPTGHRAMIEWRFRRIGKTDVPYATIMRYFVSDGNKQAEALVVAKVSSTEACHMAYVDATATADAMALARSAADEMADRWQCSAQPRILGAKGMINLGANEPIAR